MPRMGGAELYRRLHEEAEPTKFILASGYLNHDVRSRKGLDRSVPIVSKPWDIDELLRHVRKVLNEPTAQPSMTDEPAG